MDVPASAACVSPREEWQWFQALRCLEEALEMDQDVQSGPHQFLQDLRSACKELMSHMNIPVSQVRASPRTVQQAGRGLRTDGQLVYMHFQPILFPGL